MRNILFVLVFVSIILLGCGENNSLLEKCADDKYQNYQFRDYKGRKVNINYEEFFKKSYKEKIKVGNYEYFHKKCEEERKVSPETFKVRYE